MDWMSPRMVVCLVCLRPSPFPSPVVLHPSCYAPHRQPEKGAGRKNNNKRPITVSKPQRKTTASVGRE